MKEVDARGLSCPAPVLRTKAVLQEDRPDSIMVVVDNRAAAQNVTRFLESRGFAVRVEDREGGFAVHGRGGESPEETPRDETACEYSAARKIMVFAATDRIGVGDDELGVKLMISFIKTLKEMGPELWRLVLVNNGVKLTVEGSPVLEELKEFEKRGVTLLVCGTCLNHFNLLDKKQTGQTTNMLDIVTAMQLADKVVSV